VGAMKNLAMALDDLQKAEVSLLKAARWTIIKGLWCSPNGEHKLSQDEAIQEIKRTWVSSEAS